MQRWIQKINWDAVGGAVVVGAVGLFWLGAVLLAVGVGISLFVGFIMYALPALFAVGAALYLLYGILILVVSAPFSLVMFVIGLSNGQRSTSFHRTRNLFTVTITVLLVADILDLSFSEVTIFRAFGPQQNETIEAHMPGFWAVFALIIYLHLMRQIFFDGFETISQFKKEALGFWKLAKWPPASLIGIISDFIFPTVLIVSFIGMNATAFEHSVGLLGGYLNNGVLEFSEHYFGSGVDIAGWVSSTFGDVDGLMAALQALFLEITDATLSFLRYWYQDFL